MLEETPVSISYKSLYFAKCGTGLSDVLLVTVVYNIHQYAISLQHIMNLFSAHTDFRNKMKEYITLIMYSIDA